MLTLLAEQPQQSTVPVGRTREEWRVAVLTRLCKPELISTGRPLEELFPHTAALWQILDSAQNYVLGESSWLSQLCAICESQPPKATIDEVRAWWTSPALRSVSELLPFSVQLPGEQVQTFSGIVFLDQCCEGVSVLAHSMSAITQQ